MRPMKFALFGNTYQAKKSAHVERLLSILSKHQAEVYICREFYQFLTNDLKMYNYFPKRGEIYSRTFCK